MSQKELQQKLDAAWLDTKQLLTTHKTRDERIFLCGRLDALNELTAKLHFKK